MKKLLLALCCVLFFLVVGWISTSRRVVPSTPASQQALLARIDQSQDYNLRIVPSADAPLGILTAVTRRISGYELQALTGTVPAYAESASLPAVQVHNRSDKTIIAFAVGIRDDSDGRRRTVFLT